MVTVRYFFPMQGVVDIISRLQSRQTWWADLLEDCSERLEVASSIFAAGDDQYSEIRQHLEKWVNPYSHFALTPKIGQLRQSECLNLLKASDRSFERSAPMFEVVESP